jgi:hypothetical protein
MPRITLLVALLVAVVGGGCYTGYSYPDYYAGSYGPAYAYAGPGVSVVTGLDYPVYYADNYYWRFSGGYWYSSPYYYGGWTFATPPVVVARIHNPGHYAYPHYYGHRVYGHPYYGRVGPYYGGYRGAPYYHGAPSYHGGYHGPPAGGYHGAPAGGHHGGHR